MQPKINTFLLGAQKAGTTSLYDWLGQHPAIEAPLAIKDYHFFCNDTYYKKGHDHLETFYKNNEALINLHGAVNYLYFHQVSAARIHAYNPEAKLIICLRNPVDRAISAYKYFTRVLQENNSFHDALEKEINGELTTFKELSNNSYISHGFYDEQINSFLNYFNPAQLLVLGFDELTDPNKQRETLIKVFQFLNVDSTPVINFNHLNLSGTPKIKWLNRFIRESQTKKIITRLFPYAIRKKIGKTIRQKNISKTTLHVEINQNDRERLIQLYAPHQKELERILHANNLSSINLTTNKHG